MIVVKIGGSLMHKAKELVKEILKYSKEEGESVLIIPGGSIFADLVRRVRASQEAAHWMAVLAMEQYGYYLWDGTGAKLVDSIKAETGILLPYSLLKERDELPHTWDVTSDTIAAWVALQLDARFIKATDVDGIYMDGELKKEISAHELVGKQTCIDAELPRFLIKNRMGCEIVNGNCPERLISAFKGRVIGTVIKA